MEASGSDFPPNDNVNNGVSVTRMELFTHLRGNNFMNSRQSECVEHLSEYIFNMFRDKEDVILKNSLKLKLKSFVTNLFVKYTQCNRFANKLLVKHKSWIEQLLSIPLKETSDRFTESNHTKQGRPRKTFQCSSIKSKRRAVSSLVCHEDSSKLVYASQQSLHLLGKRNAAKVVEIASTATPRSLKRMKIAGLSGEQQNEHSTYTPDEALALMVDNDMTKDDYIRMQQGAKHRGCNLYPPYKQIQTSKLLCYPEPCHVIVSEDGVEVKLQCILDFTLDRLFLIQKEVFERIQENDLQCVKVLCKWGFDGSGGHSVYKQNFNNTNVLYGDSNIILCSVVPLEISNDDSTNRLIFWKATSSSSTRFCRPLMFKIVHETKDNVLDMYNHVSSQIQSILPKIMNINGTPIQFNYILLPTMFDGKIINILTNNKSTQSCYVCKAKASEMNNIKLVVSKTCDQSSFQYGLSVLHGYIRTMELLLHISYKMQLKKWQARGESEKKSVAERKKLISQKFYKEMGLVVDIPKQGGGNSNDGNTARRFFNNPQKVAEITELDEDLIYRFSVILGTLASGYVIKLKIFRKYCLDTAQKYASLYNWYNMSVTVHKLLIHGADIINSLALPVGTLTEDIQESRQKDFKNYRLFHTRKTSRLNTNTDIFNTLLVTTDPVIVNFRQKPKKKKNPFNRDIVEFFEKPLKENIDGNEIEESDDELDD